MAPRHKTVPAGPYSDETMKLSISRFLDPEEGEYAYELALSEANLPLLLASDLCGGDGDAMDMSKFSQLLATFHSNSNSTASFKVGCPVGNGKSITLEVSPEESPGIAGFHVSEKRMHGTLHHQGPLKFVLTEECSTYAFEVGAEHVARMGRELMIASEEPCFHYVFDFDHLAAAPGLNEEPCIGDPE